MRPLLEEARHVGGDHLLKGADQVFTLGKDIGHHSEDDQAGVSDQDGLSLEERLSRHLIDRWLVDRSTLSLHR